MRKRRQGLGTGTLSLCILLRGIATHAGSGPEHSTVSDYLYKPVKPSYLYDAIIKVWHAPVEEPKAGITPKAPSADPLGRGCIHYAFWWWKTM